MSPVRKRPALPPGHAKDLERTAALLLKEFPRRDELRALAHRLREVAWRLR